MRAGYPLASASAGMSVSPAACSLATASYVDDAMRSQRAEDFLDSRLNGPVIER